MKTKLQYVAFFAVLCVFSIASIAGTYSTTYRNNPQTGKPDLTLNDKVIYSEVSAAKYNPAYVPYTGANRNIKLNNKQITLDQLNLNIAPISTPVIGSIFWNPQDSTISVKTSTNTTLDVGHENFVRVVNKTGVQINDGQVVYIHGAQGNRPKVQLAIASNYSSARVIGVATENIANNAEGAVTTFGVVHGYNTSGFTEGAPLYLSPIAAGTLTATQPSTPYYNALVAIALNSTNNGSIFVSTRQPVSTDTSLLSDGATNTTPASQLAVRTKFGTQSTVIQGKLNAKHDKYAFTNNSTYTAAHIRALVDPHPAAGNNRQVQYNNNGSFAGAAQLNYSGARVGISTSNPTALLTVSSSDTNVSFDMQKETATTTNNTFRATTYGGTGESGRNAFNFRKARGTATTPTTTATGDEVFIIATQAHDGTAFREIAKMEAFAETVTGTNDISGQLRFSTRPTGSGASNTERMRITGSGKVGIGTTAPESIFHNASSAAGRGRAITGSATNRVLEDQNLGIRLKGNAVNWDDVTIPLSIIRLSTLSTPPVWASFQGSEVPSFSATATNSLFFTLQLPHNYVEGADISCHLHAGYINNGAGNSRWQITHSWANVNAAFPAATTVAATFAAPTVANQHVIHDFGTLTGTGKTISSVILFSLSRLGADAADTYASVINGVSFDCHVPRDGIGSDAATTKTATP